MLLYDELKNYMLDDTPKKYHYYKNGLIINAAITEVKDNSNGIEFGCKGLRITVWDDNKIIKCRRPSNLICECDNCYSLMNEFGEPIGYVYS